MNGSFRQDIKLKLLGTPQVFQGSWQVLKLEHPLLLCVFLVMQGDWVNRQDIIDLFWPTEEEHNAKLRLRQLLFRVRKLPWADLEAQHDLLRLNLSTDVTLFKQALASSDWQQALALYDADFLASLRRAPPAFQIWLEQMREDLYRLWHTAVLNHCWKLALSKEYKEGCIWLERLLNLDPLDEDALQLLLFHLSSLSKRTMGLKVYQQFKENLYKELGAEPGFISQALADLMSTNQAINQADLLKLYLHEDKHWPLPINLSKSHPPKRALDGSIIHTRFFGREADIAELSYSLQLPDRRLITLVGIGGVGKTRLAQEVSNYVADQFKDGILFAELASLPSAELLAERLVELLKLEPGPNRTAKEALIWFLDNKDLLLVLDNFEHILAAAGLLSELLSYLPRLRILVTSRESLGLREEWRYPLKGLAVPQIAETKDSYAAIELFLDRAQRVKLDFKPDALEKRAVVRICQLLSGLPLAIELVVTWLPLLVPEEIVAELKQNLDFLSSNDPALPERHKSMRAVLDTSWQLLNSEEQIALTQLGIFQADFHREAAMVISNLDLRLLLSLINKSLVQQHANGRFDLPVPIQQYARAKLTESEFDRLKLRFIDYYVCLAETSDEALRTPRQTEVLQRMAQEIDNFRHVFAYTLAKDADSSSRLAVSLSLFWGIRGHLYDLEGWRILSTLLAQTLQPSSDVLKAKLLRTAGARARMTKHFHLAEDYFLESLKLMRRLEPPEVIPLGRTLNELSIYFRLAEKPKEAEAYYLELLNLAEKTQNETLLKLVYGNFASYYVARYEQLRIPYNRARVTEFMAKGSAFERSQLGIAMDTRTLGLLQLHDLDFEAAQENLIASREAHHALGDTELVEFVNFYLGRLAYEQGEYQQAFGLMERGLEILRSGQKLHYLIYQLNCLARYYLEQSKRASAQNFLREAIDIQKELNFRLAYSRVFSLENLIVTGWYEANIDMVLMLIGAYRKECETLVILPEPWELLETIIAEAMATNSEAEERITKGRIADTSELIARALHSQN